jgi:tRNA modification GTPase
MDTIFARASAAGKAGVSVIRISGPLAHVAAERLAGPLPGHGRGLRLLRDAAGEPLDQALCLTFAAGQSFTGESVAELHTHGSPAVTAAVLRELAAIPGLRMAEPGEFTRRAMENGRLDLDQIEGLADLIEAETEAQRRQALRTFSGALGKRARAWREMLLRTLALITAGIDFADEEIPPGLGTRISAELITLRKDLAAELAGVGAAERIREGFEVAILGAPNAGKSTLLNALAGRDAAITSDQPGTTRDVIEVRMDVEGLAVTFLDTAGLRTTDDPVERIGVDRAITRARAADLRIWLLSPGESPGEPWAPGDLLLRAKADITPGPGPGISGLTGEGIATLVAAVAEILRERTAPAGIATRQRHARAIAGALSHIDQALAALPGLAQHPEIVAEETNRAIRAIDSIVGRVDVDDILAEVFARFCIGK